MAETAFYVAAAIAAVVGAGATAYSVATAPGAPKKPPPFKPPPLPPPVKKEEAPVSKGIEETTAGAGAMDERRRILAGLPTQTKNTYGGDKVPEIAPIQKKRLLGGGIGQETTGA